jgi:hypothetical protein
MKERREHRRLAIRLPVECSRANSSPGHAWRTATGNISTGGLYFEVDLLEGDAPPEMNALLNVELTVPPGDGHFPYEGRLSSVAEVRRCEVLPVADTRRFAIGAQFREPLKLAF